MLLIAACALAAPDMLRAAPLDYLTLRAGGFATRFDTSIRIDETEYSDSTLIDFDDELGLEGESIVEAVGLSWHFAPRHQFDLNYYDQQLSGTRQLQRDIVFQDETFRLNTTVNSRLTLRAFEFSYTWWAVLDEEWALGLRFGHMDYRLSSSMQMLFGSQGEPPEWTVEARFSERFPVPSVGLEYRHQLAEDWRMMFRVGWLEKRLKSVTPKITMAHLGLEYLPWEHVGIWVKIGMNRLDVDGRRESFRGRVRLDEGGIQLGTTWRY